MVDLSQILSVYMNNQQMKPYELIAYFILKMMTSCLKFFVHMQFVSHNYVDF